MIESAMKALRASQLAHFSVNVLYSRGEEHKAIKAIVGHTLLKVTNEYGDTLRTSSRDYIVPTTEMDLEPRPGDVIIEEGREYEVLAIKGECCWKWSDPQHTARRIHTKLIGGDE